jgi:hypothetical protein
MLRATVANACSDVYQGRRMRTNQVGKSRRSTCLSAATQTQKVVHAALPCCACTEARDPPAKASSGWPSMLSNL